MSQNSPKPTSYCAYVRTLDKDNVHRIYHDDNYGVVIEDDNELFERLVLEINQAGLSWNTILQKQKNFRKAYDNFNIKKVASYGENEKARLLADEGIIRNRLKIDAAIHNANVIVQMQKDKKNFGSFKKWLDFHYPKTREEWTKLFKNTFKFTGGEIVNEFLMSTAYLPGAHDKDCEMNKKK